jgi:hypothetical protein
MGDSSEQIAEDLQRTQKAIEALSLDLAENGFDCDHVRTRLGDFSTVLSSLRERVLALGNQQSLIVAAEPQEKHNET